MATDQEIRDAGLKYVPKQKYLQNPYELPIPEPLTNMPVNGGITNTSAFTGGGNDGFSVYNPDPNTISNQNYDDSRYQTAINRPYQTSIDNQEFQENAAYDGKPQSNFQKMLSQGINFIPGVGLAKKGLEYLGDMLPTNRRAIFENELAGQGVRVNDIGQIVQGQGDYNTAENIMAGYNASKIDADTFSKRRGTIENTLGSKYNLSASQIEAARNNPNYKGPGSNLIDRLGALDASEKSVLGTATDKTNIIYEDDEEQKKKKKKKKDTVVGRYITKKKEKKAAADIVDVEAVKANIKKAEDAAYYTPDGTPGGGAGQGIDISGAGTIRSSDNNFQGDSGPTTQQESDYGYGSDFGFASGGRAGYFFGGRVNYKAGGRINFRGGGMDMGNASNQAQSAAMGNSTSAPGPGDTGGEGGNNPSDNSDTQFGGGNNNNGGANNNPPVTVVNNPVDISTVTKSVGDYEIPVGLEALMADKGKLQAVLNADNILDKNIGAEFTYDKGPFSIGAYADMDGDKSLNANYTRNNSNYSFDLNDGGGQLKFTRTFANGGLAGLL